MKEFVDSLELNNKVWFRKLVRWLGGRLLPNFDVEEIVMTNRTPAAYIQSKYVLIGESMNEYEVYDPDVGSRFVDKWRIDEECTVTDVLYKDIDTCSVVCSSRLEQLQKWESTTLDFVWTKPDTMNKEDFELLIDKMEEELLKKTKTTSMWARGTNGVFEIRLIYSKAESKKVNKIKGKYDGKIYT